VASQIRFVVDPAGQPRIVSWSWRIHHRWPTRVVGNRSRCVRARTPGLCSGAELRGGLADRQSNKCSNVLLMPRQPPFHVWVDLTGKWSLPAPGVLLAWRRTERRGWEAWVVRVESYSTGTGSEVLVSQSWVSTALVRPVDGS
jgi:hypothetical protein